VFNTLSKSGLSVLFTLRGSSNSIARLCGGRAARHRKVTRVVEFFKDFCASLLAPLLFLKTRVRLPRDA
jgi:hypothetical protein